MTKSKAIELAAQLKFVQQSLRPIIEELKKNGYQEEVENMVDADRHLNVVRMSMEWVDE